LPKQKRRHKNFAEAKATAKKATAKKATAKKLFRNKNPVKFGSVPRQ